MSNKVGFGIVFNSLLITLSLILSVEFALTVPLQRQTTETSPLEIILLHNNDMHARFDPTDKYSAMLKTDDVDPAKSYGGFARTAHVIKKYREEAEKGGPPVLYLNAGDTYAGTPWFSIFKDKVSSEFMNLLKPDAMVRIY